MVIPKIRGLRWWIIGLVMLGAIINFLTRQTLSLAAPTLKTTLAMTEQQYSHIIEFFQYGLILQPVCGYILQLMGLRVGYAMFGFVWSVVNMAHGLAGTWQALAGLRGVMGFAEGSGHPAAMKALSDWFPAKERGFASGIYNIGASVGSMVAPPLVAWSIYAFSWQAAFVVTGGIGVLWAALWLLCYNSPEKHPALSSEEKHYIASGQEAHLQGENRRPRIRDLIKQRNFWGIALPRFLADPTWGTLSFWVPLYLTTVRHFDLKQIAIFAWMPFLAADLGCMAGGTIAAAVQKHTRLSLVNARRCAFTVGALIMTPIAFVGLVDSPYVAISLLCLGGFAHQTLSVTVITMSSDLFKKHEVSTVTGMAGTCGNIGVLIFSALIGRYVTTIGYTPFFIALGILDLVGAVTLWTLVRERRPGLPLVGGPQKV